MRVSAILFMVVSLAAPLAAQHQHGSSSAGQPASPTTSCSAPSLGAVPEEVLRRSVGLRPNLGEVHEPVTTASAEAQTFYDQGLAYVHGYVWIEAARSFHQALRLDPKLAMAHAGLSRVYINLKDKPAARRHAEAAKAMSEGLTKREQLRIDAQLAQVAAVENAADDKLRDAYRVALDAALAADIDNPEVWLLRGNAEEKAASGIGQQGGIATVPYYESAMKRAPSHPAPHHYLVHTYENLGRFHTAAEEGEKYAALSPAIPHALHMYGHDLMKVGRMDDAIDFFTRADGMERAYYNGESVSPDLDWHHAHNLSLLGMSHRYVGRLARAESLFREIAALRPYLPEYAFMYKADLLGYLLARGAAEEVLRITAASKPQTAIERAFDAISAGRAYVQLGRLGDARAAKARAVAEMPEVGKLFPEWPGFATFYTQSFLDLLDGLTLYAVASTREAGREKLRGFAGTVRAAFTGPDQWIAGLYELELIARTALRQQDLEFARAAVKQLEEHDPVYPGTLYARALLAEREGDRKTARELFGRAAAAWSKADDFDDVRAARTRAAR